MFSYDDIVFRYEPFPIGIARSVFSRDLYRELAASFPSMKLFSHHPQLGHKYSLTEKSNADGYARFIRDNRGWREVHTWIKSEAFISSVIDMLNASYINLGQKPRSLRARFEFSMLPADGGYILPHTDSWSKLVTLVVSMAGENEWRPDFGGGTDVNRPKDVRHAFNWLNVQAGFNDMEVLATFEYQPNQAVVFIKTFNSWHSVRPMTGAGSPLMRKTLTINIENAG